MRSANGAAEDGQDDSNALALGLYAYYSTRPEALEQLSLYLFASNQHVTTTSSSTSIPFMVEGITKHVRPRSKPAIVRIYPRMNPESHGSEYYYSMLVLHVPWRDEAASFPLAAAEEADILANIQDALHSAGQGRMSDAEYEQAQRQLVGVQREVFDTVRRHARDTQIAGGRMRPATPARASAPLAPPPLCIFVTGGAGTGKSFLIALLYELLLRAHQGVVTQPVRLAAPTGVAASNIGGSTLHSLLNLPVEDQRAGRAAANINYRALTGQKPQVLQANLAGLRYLIIDEISMVSHGTLAHVSRRLGEAMGNSQVYGGISLIFVGDFFQLPPALWSEGLQPFNLVANQRQHGDAAWIEALNALRTCCIQDDVDCAIELLRSRLSVTAGAAKLEAGGVRVFDFHASHRELLPTGVVGNTPVPESLIPRTADTCGGLHKVVRLAVGACVMLRRNINTADKLVNGALGTVQNFEFRDSSGAEEVLAVIVVFDDVEVGRFWRESNGVQGHEGVAIRRTTSAFKGAGGRQLQRTQFAFESSMGVAVHKVQSISMDMAVIDLVHSLFEKGQAYVALSRVRSLEGGGLKYFAGKDKVCQVSERVLSYYQGLGFVPAVCNHEEEEEEQALEREAMRVEEGIGCIIEAEAGAGEEGVLGHRYPQFPIQIPSVGQMVNALAAAFQQHQPPISWGPPWTDSTGWYVNADQQEQLINTSQSGQQIMWFGHQIAMQAAAQLQQPMQQPSGQQQEQQQQQQQQQQAQAEGQQQRNVRPRLGPSS
ncbi:P-loop containing nucleoside triphosphate hydrolase protein [Dunaliella salina]|uniref:ATP-dependent DNA helicase n=1 Tax=Dunaliella salina TaxID=3046 RepID=A0ABQ7FZ09_DUNSA|nr:P-loop containing nucleoside triphosphate hydrolase protein [Dunaliella salina]|eukprot:KAF5827585.1 P-loop containing nucleoside triphosphate hydrolase protein [Dunaliella salina]